MCVYATAGGCPCHYSEHAPWWNIWLGPVWNKDSPRLPRPPLSPLTPHMCGKHTQHPGRACAASHLPAAGNPAMAAFTKHFLLHNIQYALLPMTFSGYYRPLQGPSLSRQAWAVGPHGRGPGDECRRGPGCSSVRHPAAHRHSQRVSLQGAPEGHRWFSLSLTLECLQCCVWQGLGAPFGTMLAGPRDFISQAVRCRKALGGGLRQVGILAAAGKMALVEMATRLKEDHHNARTFAGGELCVPLNILICHWNILFWMWPSFNLLPSSAWLWQTSVCFGLGYCGDQHCTFLSKESQFEPYRVLQSHGKGHQAGGGHTGTRYPSSDVPTFWKLCEGCVASWDISWRYPAGYPENAVCCFSVPGRKSLSPLKHVKSQDFYFYLFY